MLPLIIHQSKIYKSAGLSENFIHIFLALTPGYPRWLVLETLQVSSSVTLPWLPRSRSRRVAFSGEACLVTGTSADPSRRDKHEPLGPSWSSTCKLNPQILPHCVWITWQLAMLLKFGFSHLLTRLLLSKSPPAHPMICFQGRSSSILNGWFITPSSGRIVEPCHLNFRTLVPFLFTFCLPSALLQVLLWGDPFCSLRVWLL